MRPVLTLALLVVLGCSAERKPEPVRPSPAPAGDAAVPRSGDPDLAPSAPRLVLIPFAGYAGLFPADAVDAPPTLDDLARGQALVLAELRAHPPREDAALADKAPGYYRQAIGYRSGGHRHLFVNYVCAVEGDWRTQLLVVKDGGSCYFQADIDLDAGAVAHLTVNGQG